MTPIERAAKALRDLTVSGEEANRYARAVLQAIREPSEGMRDAALAMKNADNVDDTWQAMIDAALGG